MVFIREINAISIDPNQLGILINSYFEKMVTLREIVTETFNEKIKRTDIKRKNKINSMSDNYYRVGIRDYIGFFNEIHDFLSNPANERANKRYNLISRDIKRKLTAFKVRFTSFDETFEYVLSEFNRRVCEDFELELEQIELVPVLFAYMYYFCDIGENYETEAE